MPKVSIIVPVYKVEKYLDRCVQSLINQTLKDIEIILVDDDKYSVIGISHGVNPPYLSLEIKKTDSNLEGKSITV